MEETISIIASSVITVITLVTKKLVSNIDEKFDKFDKRFKKADIEINENIRLLRSQITFLKKSNSDMQATIIKGSIKHVKETRQELEALKDGCRKGKLGYGKVIYLEDFAKQTKTELEYQKKKLNALIEALGKK